MFKTFVGPVADDASTVYLRPETAQAMFVNFDNVVTSMRRKLPFGIAQIGRSFRNEITPGNFIFRDREFEQMEMEYFFKPGTDEEWHDHWIEERLNWWLGLGVRKENLRIRAHAKEELSHYSKRTSTSSTTSPSGLVRARGHRQPHRLRPQGARRGRRQHAQLLRRGNKRAHRPLRHRARGRRRPLLPALLIDAYAEEEVKDEKRVVLRLHPALAPIKVAVLPLSRNEKLARPRARSRPSCGRTS